MRCSARTAYDGKPCRMDARRGTDLCFRHHEATSGVDSEATAAAELTARAEERRRQEQARAEVDATYAPLVPTNNRTEGMARGRRKESLVSKDAGGDR